MGYFASFQRKTFILIIWAIPGYSYVKKEDRFFRVSMATVVTRVTL